MCANSQDWEKSIVIDIQLRYSLLFVHRLHWSFYQYFFEWVPQIWPCLFFSAQFDIPHSIPFQVTLCHFTKFKTICQYRYVIVYLVFADNFIFVPKNNTKNKIFINEVALHQWCRILPVCSSFVCKLPHECEDITKNTWRTPLNAQCNIKYQLQYSLFFTLLNYLRNRLFLNFLVNYQISIISLLFWVSILNLADSLFLSYSWVKPIITRNLRYTIAYMDVHHVELLSHHTSRMPTVLSDVGKWEDVWGC